MKAKLASLAVVAMSSAVVVLTGCSGQREVSPPPESDSCHGVSCVKVTMQPTCQSGGKTATMEVVLSLKDPENPTESWKYTREDRRNDGSLIGQVERTVNAGQGSKETLSIAADEVARMTLRYLSEEPFEYALVGGMVCTGADSQTPTS